MVNTFLGQPFRKAFYQIRKTGAKKCLDKGTWAQKAGRCTGEKNKAPRAEWKLLALVCKDRVLTL